MHRGPRGVQIKLLRTRAVPERLGGVFTTRRYTNPRLPLPYLKMTVYTNYYKKKIYDVKEVLVIIRWKGIFAGYNSRRSKQIRRRLPNYCNV